MTIVLSMRYFNVKGLRILKSRANSYLLQSKDVSNRPLSSVASNFLDDESIEQFQTDGAVPLRNMFNPHCVEQVARGIQKSLETPSIYSDMLKDKDGSGLFFNDYCKWRSIPEFTDFVQNSICAEIAGRLMRSKTAVFFHDHVFVKKGGTQRSTPWHQDQPYYSIDGFQTCSIWMPVTHIKKESSLQFLKGSHKWSKKFIPRKFESTKDYKVDRDCSLQFTSLSNELLQEGEILSWELEPGDCVAFHMQTLHGTSGAVSPTTRRVLVTRWLGDDCVVADRPWTTSPPLDAFNIKITPGTKVTEIDAFPTLWTEKEK